MFPDLRINVTMSLVRALWGEVTPDLRAVLARLGVNDEISIEFYLDGEPTAEFAERASSIETEVMADFPENFSVRHELLRLDPPVKIPVGDAILVYMRKEI
jgi:hypothetical protein